jgi:adenylate cyclase
MTALANPNHIVIGQPVYDALVDGQKSMYQHLNINSDVWNYVSSSTGGNIYKVYTDVNKISQKIHFLIDLERNRPILE